MRLHIPVYAAYNTTPDDLIQVFGLHTIPFNVFAVLKRYVSNRYKKSVKVA